MFYWEWGLGGDKNTAVVQLQCRVEEVGWDLEYRREIRRLAVSLPVSLPVFQEIHGGAKVWTEDRG